MRFTIITPQRGSLRHAEQCRSALWVSLLLWYKWKYEDVNLGCSHGLIKAEEGLRCCYRVLFSTSSVPVMTVKPSKEINVLHPQPSKQQWKQASQWKAAVIYILLVQTRSVLSTGGRSLHCQEAVPGREILLPRCRGHTWNWKFPEIYSVLGQLIVWSPSSLFVFQL